jgi:2-polyprenyl-3-methyl-5-hydroxy-6-metoxy-1,4-benzoquinol methylase
MNVQQVVKEIHARIESETAPSGSSLAADINELTALKAAYGRLYQIRNLVGQTPPGPNTLRARLGGHFVRLVQRMLFWHTPQIRRVHNEITNALGSACVLIERQFRMIGELRQEIEALRRAQVFVEQRSRSGGEDTAGLTPTDSRPAELPPAFQFALQDHFRGSEAVTADRLAVWLRNIETLTAGAPPAMWVDIGCGRGEWLAMAAREGRQITGIDSNPASIELCRAKGLHAEMAEAIDYLRALPDASLVVVTAFHVVEHIPMESLLTLITEVARTLQPGGLFAAETPNAGNILMGSHHFWNDPTHQRPIPAALLEFVFDYCGLRTVKRLALNPAPVEEHLPYAEIDLIRRVDEHLYGPRDYGLIGRRET